MDEVFWKNVLLHWVNETGFLIVDCNNFEYSDIATFYSEFVKQFKDNPMYQDAFHFLRENYPEFQINLSDNGSLLPPENLYIYSLFLHYSCVKNPQQYFHDICKKLKEDFQCTIAIFFKTIMEEITLNREALDRAMLMASRNSSDENQISADTSIQISQMQILSTPKTRMLDCKIKEIHALKAQVDTERYEKVLLEAQIKQQEERIEQLTKGHKRNLKEIEELKSVFTTENLLGDLFFHQDLRNGTVENHWKKEILNKEETIFELRGSLQNLTIEKKLLTEKLSFTKTQCRRYQKKVKQYQYEAISLKKTMEEKDRTIEMLINTRNELQKFIDDTRSSKICNTSVECLDTSFTSKHTNSFSSVVDVENLGSSVIDIKLKEIEKENSLLRDEIYIMKKDKCLLEKNIHNLVDLCTGVFSTFQHDIFGVEDLNQKFTVLEKCLKNMITDYNASNNTIKDLEVKIRDLDTERKCLREETEKLESVLSMLTQHLFPAAINKHEIELKNCLNPQIIKEQFLRKCDQIKRLYCDNDLLGFKSTKTGGNYEDNIEYPVKFNNILIGNDLENVLIRSTEGILSPSVKICKLQNVFSSRKIIIGGGKDDLQLAQLANPTEVSFSKERESSKDKHDNIDSLEPFCKNTDLKPYVKNFGKKRTTIPSVTQERHQLTLKSHDTFRRSDQLPSFPSKIRIKDINLNENYIFLTENSKYGFQLNFAARHRKKFNQFGNLNKIRVIDDLESFALNINAIPILRSQIISKSTEDVKETESKISKKETYFLLIKESRSILHGIPKLNRNVRNMEASDKLDKELLTMAYNSTARILKSENKDDEPNGTDIKQYVKENVNSQEQNETLERSVDHFEKESEPDIDTLMNYELCQDEDEVLYNLKDTIAKCNSIFNNLKMKYSNVQITEKDLEKFLNETISRSDRLEFFKKFNTLEDLILREETEVRRLQKLEGKYEDLSSSYFTVVTENLKLKDNVKNLQINFNDSQKICEQFQKQSEKFKTDIDILSAKLYKCRQTLSTKEKEWTKEKSCLFAEMRVTKERLREIRLELERKLDKMKAKMKIIHVEEVNKIVCRMDEIKSKLQSALKKNEKCENYILKLSRQIFDLNERNLELHKLNKFMETRLKEYQPLSSSSYTTTSTFCTSRLSLEALRRIAGISTPLNKYHMFSNLDMEDEEGEVFNNTYLTNDLPFEKNYKMLQESQHSNSSVPFHLKSTSSIRYSLPNKELNNVQEKMSADLSDSLTSAFLTSPRKKIKGTTSYKKPGPPTPGKNAGRLSLGCSSISEKEVLKDVEKSVHEKKIYTEHKNDKISSTRQLFLLKRKK